jgi:hypothetical protein
MGMSMSNDNQIPTAEKFLNNYRFEAGESIGNRDFDTMALYANEYAKLHVEQIKQFLYGEICERREYSASRMCEEVLKFIYNNEQ